jgi:peptidoglycan biosynthesis protein MviN/MurJ (putative lipid II flippase)
MFIHMQTILKSFANFMSYHFEDFLLNSLFICNRHFFPYGRTDLATAASLQPICGSLLQLHGPLLCSCGNLGP